MAARGGPGRLGLGPGLRRGAIVLPPAGPVQYNGDVEMATTAGWTAGAGWTNDGTAWSNSGTTGTLSRTAAAPVTDGTYDYEIAVENPNNATLTIRLGGNTGAHGFLAGGSPTQTGQFTVTGAVDNILRIRDPNGDGGPVRVLRLSITRAA